jgi:hypothetical protein
MPRSLSAVTNGEIQSLRATITNQRLASDWLDSLVECEIRRFKLVLDHLIKKSSATKGKVRTEIVDI